MTVQSSTAYGKRDVAEATPQIKRFEAGVKKHLEQNEQQVESAAKVDPRIAGAVHRMQHYKAESPKALQEKGVVVNASPKTIESAKNSSAAVARAFEGAEKSRSLAGRVDAASAA